MDKDAILNRFAEIWPVHTREFTRLLIHLRETFDGDLDMLLVFAAIADCVLSPRGYDGPLSYQDRLQGPDRSVRAAPINILSVAGYTGIPRETVRRKVAAFLAKGWLERGPEGYVKVSGRAANDLAEATHATARYLEAVTTVCAGAPH